MPPRVRLKRIYDAPSSEDGRRVLVDRIWPRGVKKETARVDGWLKDLAPSSGLRKWFAHDPEKWEEFRRRYLLELGDRDEDLRRLREDAEKHTVTLLFAARDEIRNNAAVLKEAIERENG